MRRYINITVRLADKRVLLSGTVKSKWGITLGLQLGGSEALAKFDSMMMETFGVNVRGYDDNFADMRRLSPIRLIAKDIIIIPFVVELKKLFKFKAPSDNLFRAMEWKTLLNEIMTKTAYPPANQPTAHTGIAVEVARELQIRGVFDE